MTLLARSLLWALGIVFVGAGCTNKQERRGEVSDTGDSEILVVAITETQILVDGANGRPVLSFSATREQLATSGVEAKHKEGLVIVPLAEALKKGQRRDAAGPASEAIVVGAASTPYRVLVEVLYTLGQSGVQKHHLMLASDAGASHAIARGTGRSGTFQSGAAEPSAPTANGPLDLRVWVTERGVYFKTSEGPIGAGCIREAQGVTVPVSNGAHDFNAVTQCARRLKGSRKDSDVVLTANSSVELGTILDTMDALHGSDDVLFPEVRFGIVR